MARTVDIFSGVCGRRLYLWWSPPARTDGTNIFVPPGGPTCYQDLEHELAHILFESDYKLISAFQEEYTRVIEESLARVKTTRPVLVPRVKSMLRTILNCLEDYRVNRLWGEIYPGSWKIIQEQDRKAVDNNRPRAFWDVGNYLLSYAAAPDLFPQDRNPYFDLNPIIDEALRTVDKKGPEASLVAAKQFVTRLVDRQVEIVRKSPKGHPKKHSRHNALETVARKWKLTYDGIGTRVSGDVVENPNAKGNEAAERVKKYVALSLRDTAETAAALSLSEKRMQATIARAKEAIALPKPRTRLGSNSWGTVHFQPAPRVNRSPLEPPWIEPSSTIRRLKSRLQTVRMRNREMRTSEGTDLDVDRLIEERLSGRPEGVFRLTSAQRGMRMLVLLDHSSSMRDNGKIWSAERACYCLSRAADLPGVEFECWTFEGGIDGVHIYKCDPKHRRFGGFPDGCTPMADAIYHATQYLQRTALRSHLVLVTDGLPYVEYADSTVDPGLLRVQVRQQVQAARSHGISVSALFLGANEANLRPIPEFSRTLGFMFGSPRTWELVAPCNTESALVRMAANNFSSLLKK